MILYPKDTLAEQRLEKLVSRPMETIIEQYTEATGEGGHTSKNNSMLSIALYQLMKECEETLKTEFPDLEPSAIKIAAEKIVMRGMLRYSLNDSDIRQLQQLLGLSQEINSKIKGALAGQSLTEM